jgi:hypothetical protein
MTIMSHSIAECFDDAIIESDSSNEQLRTAEGTDFRHPKLEDQIADPLA